MQLLSFTNHLNRLLKKDFNLKELLKGSFLALVFRFFSVIIGYILIFVLTKYFGVQGLGFYSTLWTILLVVSVVAKLGFDTSVVKYTAIWSNKAQRARISGLYFQILTILVFTGSFSAIILFLFSNKLSLLFFNKANFSDSFILLSFTILPFILLNINAEIHKGLKNISLFSIFQNGGINLVFIFLLIGFALYGAREYENIVESLFLSIFILFIISCLTLVGEFPLKKRIKTFSQKKIVQLSFPMLLSNSIFLFLNWTDIIILSILKTEGEVGIYNTSLKISALISIGLMGISSIAMPKFAQLKDEYFLLRKFSKQISLLASIFGIPLFIIIVIGAKPLLSLFGKEFLVGQWSLIILAFGNLFKVLSGLSIDLLSMTGKERISKNILIISIMLNILLNFIFIPIWGISGAAVATAFTTVFWSGSAAYFVYRKYHFIPFADWGYYKNLGKKIGKYFDFKNLDN